MAGKADPYAAGVSSPDFEIVEEKQVHRRYLTLYDRRIKFQARQGREVSGLAINLVPGWIGWGMCVWGGGWGGSFRYSDHQE